MKFKKTLNREAELFTAILGSLGSGKTYTLAYFAVSALHKNEPIFINTAINLQDWENLKDLPSFMSVDQYANWRKQNSTLSRCAVVYWSALVELLHPEVRCGTIFFDELGTLENCPYPLVVKLINLRKDHLTVFATVQDDKLASSDLRKFFNRCLVMEEQHPWFTAFLFPDRVRPKLVCDKEGCSKNCGHMTSGDFPGKFPFRTTRYCAEDVDPKYTGNKDKKKSRGKIYIPFNLKIANVYRSSAVANEIAMETYKRVNSKNYNPKKYPMASKPQPTIDPNTLPF